MSAPMSPHQKYLRANQEALEFAVKTGRPVFLRWDARVQDFVLFTPMPDEPRTRIGRVRIPFPLQLVLSLLSGMFIGWLLLAIMRLLP